MKAPTKITATLIALSILATSPAHAIGNDYLDTNDVFSLSTPLDAKALSGLLIPAVETLENGQELAIWPFCGKKCKSRKWQKKQRVKVCGIAAPAVGLELGGGKTVVCEAG